MLTAAVVPTESATLPTVQELPNIISNLLPENPLTSMVTGEMLSIVILRSSLGFRSQP